MTVRQKSGILRTDQAEAARAHDGYDHSAGTVQLMRETIPRRAAETGATPAGLGRVAVPSSPALRYLGTAVRVLFGLIWAIDVYFKWQPSFLHGLPEVMSDGIKGQPSFLMPWFHLVQGLIAIHPTAWAYATAITETAIAAGLLLGIARKLVYVSGAVWSLMIWSTAEGLGRMRDGVATDIGTAIIYVVVFLALLALDARAWGTRPFSLDAVIERRLPWWRRIAEVRR